MLLVSFELALAMIGGRCRWHCIELEYASGKQFRMEII
uniref:Uncharacterized protein n=1 Tax=Arundo donax TaxID=35708 RepID=A0A0A9CQ00_ARUDO